MKERRGPGRVCVPLTNQQPSSTHLKRQRAGGHVRSCVNTACRLLTRHEHLAENQEHLHLLKRPPKVFEMSQIFYWSQSRALKPPFASRPNTRSKVVSFCLLFLVASPLPRLPPLHRRLICWPSRQTISPESGTLAVLFVAAASPTRPRTRRQIRPSSAHGRCSAACLVGAIVRCSLPPLPRMNFNHLFCFRHG
jgi:hypothetical protein